MTSQAFDTLMTMYMEASHVVQAVEEEIEELETREKEIKDDIKKRKAFLEFTETRVLSNLTADLAEV